jgi:hypothetical protein
VERPTFVDPIVGPTDAADSGQPNAAPGVTETPSRPFIGPVDLVGGVVSAAVAQVRLIVRPEAAAAVAAEFTFPLALALAVLLFLVVQDQMDRRDPKLRMAPENVGETLIGFTSEDKA